jgi:hypothetical protein
VELKIGTEIPAQAEMTDADRVRALLAAPLGDTARMQSAVLTQLLYPGRIWSRTECLTRPSPVPAVPGVYAWYFRAVPADVPAEGCHRYGDLTLLYVGISPRRPPENGAQASRQNLRKRIRYHYRGNAEGSTLRLTLGCLLSTQLGIGLRRVGSGSRLTFAAGEQRLSEWMETNAYVCWAPTADPRHEEMRLIGNLVLPLNIEGNKHTFCRVLSEIRSGARAHAAGLPVLA